MAGKLSLSFIDYSKERSAAGMHLPAFTAGNFAAQQTLTDTLKAAVEAVSLLNLVTDTRTVDVIKSAIVIPTDQDAQREKKWLVRASDDVTGKPVQFEIPGSDLTLLVASSDAMDIAAGAGLALVNAIEAVVTSDVGNAITVADVVYVGRNL